MHATDQPAAADPPPPPAPSASPTASSPTASSASGYDSGAHARQLHLEEKLQHHAHHDAREAADPCDCDDSAVSATSASGSAAICGVCLDPLTMRIAPDGTEHGPALFLPCLHGFHATCVVDWLPAHAHCPLCRARVTAPQISMLFASTGLDTDATTARSADRLHGPVMSGEHALYQPTPLPTPPTPYVPPRARCAGCRAALLSGCRRGTSAACGHAVCAGCCSATDGNFTRTCLVCTRHRTQQQQQQQQQHQHEQPTVSRYCGACFRSLEPGDKIVRFSPVCGHEMHVACRDALVRLRVPCPKCVLRAAGAPLPCDVTDELCAVCGAADPPPVARARARGAARRRLRARVARLLLLRRRRRGADSDTEGGGSEEAETDDDMMRDETDRATLATPSPRRAGTEEDEEEGRTVATAWGCAHRVHRECADAALRNGWLCPFCRRMSARVAGALVRASRKAQTQLLRQQAGGTATGAFGAWVARGLGGRLPSVSTRLLGY